MKLKIWEISLAVALVVAILWGVLLSQQQEELASKLIRLHVLANSDLEDDQEMKLYVRDCVLEELDGLLSGSESRSQAESVIEENLESITERASLAVSEYGGSYAVSAELTREGYPTREYDTFTLPAGEYTSLRVKIGEAQGQNWWCVVFPPLCVEAAEGEKVSVEAANLSDDEVSLITGEDSGYVIKFKTLEIIQQVKSFFADSD